MIPPIGPRVKPLDLVATRCQAHTCQQDGYLPSSRQGKAGNVTGLFGAGAGSRYAGGRPADLPKPGLANSWRGSISRGRGVLCCDGGDGGRFRVVMAMRSRLRGAPSEAGAARASSPRSEITRNFVRLILRCPFFCIDPAAFHAGAPGPSYTICLATRP